MQTDRTRRILETLTDFNAILLKVDSKKPKVVNLTQVFRLHRPGDDQRKCPICSLILEKRNYRFICPKSNCEFNYQVDPLEDQVDESDYLDI